MISECGGEMGQKAEGGAPRNPELRPKAGDIAALQVASTDAVEPVIPELDESDPATLLTATERQQVRASLWPDRPMPDGRRRIDISRPVGARAGTF
jgi:hypothetical protein